MVNTEDFGSSNRGSIPFASTKNTIFKDIHYKNLTVIVGYRILIAQDVECLRCIILW